MAQRLRDDHGLNDAAIDECFRAAMHDPGSLDLAELVGRLPGKQDRRAESFKVGGTVGGEKSERDRSVERLLKATPRSALPGALSPACLDAGAIASWVEGRARAGRGGPRRGARGGLSALPGRARRVRARRATGGASRSGVEAMGSPSTDDRRHGGGGPLARLAEAPGAGSASRDRRGGAECRGAAAPACARPDVATRSGPRRARRRAKEIRGSDRDRQRGCR